MKFWREHLLAHLRPQVITFLDALQFAYHPQVGVDDAIIYLLLSHLDKADRTVWVMFFDFSTAFNTIQPVLLQDKLEKMHSETSTTSWITKYLMDRPQFVRLQGCMF